MKTYSVPKLLCYIFHRVFKMNRPLFLVLLISICSSCNRRTKHSFSQSFEQLSGWADESGIVKGNGYSGNYFTRTGEVREYSRTFSMRLGDISEKPVRRIDMGAWIRTSEPGAFAKLVLSIEAGDSIVFWQGLETSTVSPKQGEWTRLYFTYDLPEGMQPDYSVKMFLWNQSRKEVDADDFDIHFYTK